MEETKTQNVVEIVIVILSSQRNNINIMRDQRLPFDIANDGNRDPLPLAMQQHQHYEGPTAYHGSPTALDWQVNRLRWRSRVQRKSQLHGSEGAGLAR